MRVERYGKTRFWAVYDASGTLVVVTVYKKGAQEVMQRLAGSGRRRRFSVPQAQATIRLGPKPQR